MKECFGLQMAFGPEGMAPEPEEREKCFNCEDFDKCFKYALIRSMHSLKFEIRNGVTALRKSIGGSHSEFPLW